MAANFGCYCVCVCGGLWVWDEHYLFCVEQLALTTYILGGCGAATCELPQSNNEYAITAINVD